MFFLFFKQIFLLLPNSVISPESLVKRKKGSCIYIFQANSTIPAKVFLFSALQILIAM